MARATPIYDQALENLDELHDYARLPDADLSVTDARMLLCCHLAIAQSSLAIAEALHGVVYIANANAV